MSQRPDPIRCGGARPRRPLPGPACRALLGLHRHAGDRRQPPDRGAARERRGGPHHGRRPGRPRDRFGDRAPDRGLGRRPGPRLRGPVGDRLPGILQRAPDRAAHGRQPGRLRLRLAHRRAVRAPARRVVAKRAGARSGDRHGRGPAHLDRLRPGLASHPRGGPRRRLRRGRADPLRGRDGRALRCDPGGRLAAGPAARASSERIDRLGGAGGESLARSRPGARPEPGRRRRSRLSRWRRRTEVLSATWMLRSR
jgi:hypothetical protein